MLVAGSVAVWVAVTQPGMSKLGDRTAELIQRTRLSMWTTISAGATYLLLLTGSLVTRSGAALVCPDFPNCGLAQIPDYLQPIVFVQMTHRYTAYVVAFTVTLVLWRLLRAAKHEGGMRRFAIALAALITVQFTLGIINVLTALPMWSRVLHLGTAATIWVLMVMLWVALQRGQARAAQ
jgi:heme A synthase